MNCYLNVKLFVIFNCILFVCLQNSGDGGNGSDEDDDDDSVYRGKYIGKLKSYHHQVSGELYAVDQYTLLFRNFNYDGYGLDTYFWSGVSNRPGPQGFLVPNEFGRTDLLDRYFNKDFTITLPDAKKITDIKWLAVYDLTNQVSFGEIYIPEEFEPPSAKKIAEFSTVSNHVYSSPVEIVNAKTVKIPNFRYDGKAKSAQFWMGVGSQPVSKGHIIPDENGYMDPIRAYVDETITLHLPGNYAIFNIDWISIFDLETMRNLGSIQIPNDLNVPPSLIQIIKSNTNLPFCKQLHSNFQVSWEVFGPQITLQFTGQIDVNDYMSFGISGSSFRSQAIGSDIAVAYLHENRGYVYDYNISALTSCVKVLGQYKGVCKDDLVGGQNDYQLLTANRDNGITVVTFRRSLISADHGDKEFDVNKPIYVVWSMGRLNEKNEPAFHDYYSKANIRLDLSAKEPDSNCYAFTRVNRKLLEPWKNEEIFDPTIRKFKAYIGPSAGRRGYQSMTGHASNSLAWYINGYLAPVLWLRRGLTYYFDIYGGRNPHSFEHYHPFIITNEPHGGFDALSDLAQDQIKVFAGVEFSRRGRPRPTSAGPLCLAEHRYRDRRLDDDYSTFKKFNKSLDLNCEKGPAAILEVTPNSSWPDLVFYNSFSHSNMGWKIRIVDTYKKSCAYTVSVTGSIFYYLLTGYLYVLF